MHENINISKTPSVLLFRYCILNKLLVSVIFSRSCIRKCEQFALCSCICSLRIFHQTEIRALIPKAGFGVFAGRAFKQGELLRIAWKTLFLPNNFPKTQALRYYAFGHNTTHMALVLDYGSVFNHHEGANVEAVDFPPTSNVYFRVRTGFICANHNALKKMQYACMRGRIHNRYTNT